MKLLSVFVAALAVGSISATPFLGDLLKTGIKPENGLIGTVGTVANFLGKTLEEVLCICKEITTTVSNLTCALHKIVGSLSEALIELIKTLECCFRQVDKVVGDLNLGNAGDRLCGAIEQVECDLYEFLEIVKCILGSTTEKLYDLICKLDIIVQKILYAVGFLIVVVIDVVHCGVLTKTKTKNLFALLETVFVTVGDVLCAVNGLVDKKCGLSNIISNLQIVLNETICKVSEVVDCFLNDVLNDVKDLQTTLEKILQDLLSSCKKIC